MEFQIQQNQFHDPTSSTDIAKALVYVEYGCADQAKVHKEWNKDHRGKQLSPSEQQSLTYDCSIAVESGQRQPAGTLWEAQQVQEVPLFVSRLSPEVEGKVQKVHLQEMVGAEMDLVWEALAQQFP